jgi:signal transduction histidine kinase
VSVTVKSSERKTYFEISDNGIGMDESLKKRIFEPFFSTKAGHAGLGLYMSKTYAERNEGSIVLKDTRGAGTCVEISFPDDRHVAK